MNIQKISYQDVNFGNKIVTSFIETGFAVVTDHGIDPELIESGYSSMASFFNASNALKDFVKFNPETMAGYFPPKLEKAKDAKFPDLKEFYHFYKHLEAADTDFMRLYNQLESKAIWMLEEIESELLFRGYETSSNTLLSESVKDSKKTLFRLLHYPPTDLFGEDADVMERAAAHEDINLITLLPAATNPGLQVKDIAGNWHDVEADPGSLVVNVGDMLQEATRGVLPSTTHRVVADKEARSTSRYSMPLFLHPKPDTVLSPRYTADSYLKQRLKELGLI